MPRRTDIHKILIIGAGPIVIGQACEFDYSGTQACKALVSEGFEVVLVNSNPATIMTDPDMAHITYIEPVNAETVAAIIEKESPDAMLATLGGQTALNVAVELAGRGILERYEVELIGADLAAIQKAEDREMFRQAMDRIGLESAKSVIAEDMKTVREAAAQIGFPIIIRPAYTLGGSGGGTAYNVEELEAIAASGLQASRIGQILVEASVLGWKEFELEVMRDKNDNVVIVCSIENFDPMGVHTGDSITVAPAQTLTDRQYQQMRNAAVAIMREIGVDTGGSNVQFAVNPVDGRMIVVEMNPRVSRSSALASKATGFPIAKIAALLAVGYTLDELTNDITGRTVAAFEPALDYCVVKIPRFTFEKFPETPDLLGTAMKSVGEAMAVGRTFKEALQKGLRSLEIGAYGLEDGNHLEQTAEDGPLSIDEIERKLSVPNSKRIFYLRQAFLNKMTVETMTALTGIDPWFLNQIRQIVELERQIAETDGPVPEPLLRKAKSWGFSDMQVAKIAGFTEETLTRHRKLLKIIPAYKIVDTCAGEFEAKTPYFYSAYEPECEARPQHGQKVMIIGGGPNRIGQGIEFDYCCVQAAYTLAEEGVGSIMVNCNPETVSTDYDTCDRLYFEPLTVEDVLHIVEKERPDGVIVQFGGQTPLNLAQPLQRQGVRILGTRPEDIGRAEDRRHFQKILNSLDLVQPPNGTATTVRQALKIAETIGYPLIVRPSFVLGGRAMKIIYEQKELEGFVRLALKASPDFPILIEKFLENAVEVDVDAVSDGTATIIGGIMEHIEAAGVHSGDSACVLPPQNISASMLARIREATRAISSALRVKGLMNIQFAIANEQLHVLEVNPRASRTVPFVSKSTGISLTRAATRVMLGYSLAEQGLVRDLTEPGYVCVKEAVLPFNKFPDADTLLGPEMKSTGEVMGIGHDFGDAYAKAQAGAGQQLPLSGTVFMSLQDGDKPGALKIAEAFLRLGFDLLATRGTGNFLTQNGIDCQIVNKVSQGRPHVADAIKNKQIELVVNTAAGSGPHRDGYAIRRAALQFGIPYTTTLAGADAFCRAIDRLKKRRLSVFSLQAYHQMDLSVVDRIQA